MGGLEAYGIFSAVRLYFVGDYDYWKYGGRIKCKPDVFNLRKDKYSFVKLSRLFTEQDLPYFIAINVFTNHKLWVRDLFDPQAKVAFSNWVVRQKNRSKFFQEDLNNLNDLKQLVVPKENAHPELFNKLQQTEINVDTLVILDHFMHLTKGWNETLKEDFIWTNFYKNYCKYRTFVYNYTMFDTTSLKNMITQHLGDKSE